MRQLTRSRKWKHKEGRVTSHSYWSRTHGPRGTTHGTSGRRPWLWMVSRRGIRGLNRGEGGNREGPQGSQEGARHGLGWGRAKDPSRVLVVAPFPPLVIPEASGMLIFYIIFLEFLEHF